MAREATTKRVIPYPAVRHIAKVHEGGAIVAWRLA
jgi:hypothetical protein